MEKNKCNGNFREDCVEWFANGILEKEIYKTNTLHKKIEVRPKWYIKVNMNKIDVDHVE